MTICNTCTLNLLDAHAAFVSDDEARASGQCASWRRKASNTAAGPGSAISSGCCYEDIGEARLRELVVNPLTGLTVAAFYGCHITRPPLRYGFVDSRNNVALERLAEILGCRPIDYSGRTECCGFHTAAHDEKVAIKLTGQHILSAKTGGAQAMVTPCPLCHTVLDGFQREIEKDLGQELDMPVLHLPQLVGLALGLSPEELKSTGIMVRRRSRACRRKDRQRWNAEVMGHRRRAQSRVDAIADCALVMPRSRCKSLIAHCCKAFV